MSKVMTTYRPTWIEVDLKAIKHNLLQVKSRIDKDTAVLVPVKANGYGHGLLEASRILVKSGVDYLGVGTTDEGILLRNKGFKVPVLMLGSIVSSEIPGIVNRNITQTVGDIELARAINNYCKRKRKRAKVHAKIDVGMGRIGVWHEDAIGFIRKVSRLKHIKLEGIFSHFSSADDDTLLTHRQISDFSKLLNEIGQAGIDIRYKHMANSMAVVDYKDSHMNLIRPGLMVYGLSPKKGIFGRKIDLRPALSLKSRIVFTKTVPAGRSISYGGTYITKQKSRIATIPIGYGDGFNRRLSNRGHVLIQGKQLSIIGRVCMDQIMVDISRTPSARVGDAVILIGRQGKRRISIEDIAHTCDTIPYEVSCWFDNRIPKIYLL